jgi:protein-arginine kinase activator protein McsA
MLCEYCNIKKATVTLTQNINGEVKTINICQDCANALGVIPNTLEISDSIDDIDSFFASISAMLSQVKNNVGTIELIFATIN